LLREDTVRHRSLRFVRHLLTVVAVLCLGTWSAVKLYGYVENVRDESLFAHLTRAARVGKSEAGEALRQAVAARPKDGALLGRVAVKRVGLSAFVLEGTSERCLEQGAGHVTGTALPGGGGNVVIAGHRDSVFRPLRHIELGDIVTLSTPTTTRRYAVDSIYTVTPEDTAVLEPSKDAELTLLTCYPFRYVGSAPMRFVVKAHAVARYRTRHSASRGANLPAESRRGFDTTRVTAENAPQRTGGRQ
jgi:sortase A